MFQWTALALISFVVVFLARNRRYRWIYIIIETLPRDIKGLIILIKLHTFVRRCTKENATIPKKFLALVQKHPQKTAFYFEDEVWTYAKVDEFSNKVARYFSKKGYKKGDVVALFMENCVEYPCIWLGLLKLGVNTSLINTNLVKDSLLHSITVTNCKSIIFGSNYMQQIQDVLSELTSMQRYQLHEKENDSKTILEECIDLRRELEHVSSQAIEESGFGTNHNDPAIYIFTSGTTGLPKAAVMTHIRCILLGQAYSVAGIVKPDDVFYTPLPLYHTAGGVMGIGLSILAGVSVALRRKFSASQYFLDCAKFNVTVAQYVGEQCRYILAAPHKSPIKHKVRTIIGNGLRPQIWKSFVERFGIKNVVEVYGSTEGVTNLANIDNREGAVGFLPRYFRFMYPIKLIKCDETTCEPVRNSKGRCIECDIGEPGILIGSIAKNINVFKFDGYTDRQSSNKKVLYDVFSDGDRYFNSGDILVNDELGYFYFKDRTGDTFRWKSENVSTSEVEAIMSNIVGLNDVIVYGVKIPETEGNAGMAAIVDVDGMLNMDTLAAVLKSNLPSYAVPIFIRVMDSTPLTGTFKLKKTELRNEGFNIDKIKNPLYFLHPEYKKYVELTQKLYHDILNGKLRL